MKHSELVRLLREKSDSEFLNHGGGHDKWINRKTGVVFPVPRHPAKEINSKTAAKILKLAGYKK